MANTALHLAALQNYTEMAEHAKIKQMVFSAAVNLPGAQPYEATSRRSDKRF